MLSVRSARAYKAVATLTERLLILDKIKKELLSIPSFDLGSTLQILHKNFKASRTILFIADENNIPKIDLEITDNKIIQHFKQNQIAENTVLYDEKVFRKSITEESDILYNLNHGENKSIISSPIFENEKLKALIYFEKFEKEKFEEKSIQVLKLLKSQIANIIDNAFTYIKLEDLNRNLELKVKQRTAELNIQNKEIEQKNVDLDEMLEELKVTNEIIQTVNDELNQQKNEIEQKNNILEKQKFEILEKHEELLQQREEILTINEVLEKRQEEILNKNSELETQKEEIVKKNEQITDSIEYARRIQMALLKSEKNIPFKEHFILYKPRDIVSGDFYWIKKFFNYTIVVAADCTGHGVPGAFMSMLGISFLSEVANKHFRKISKTRLSASLILEDLRESIIKALSHKEEKTQSKDGMDISLCIIDRDTNMMQFSGAYNPAYIIRDNQIIELTADKMPIGAYQKETKPFFNHEFQLIENDRIYLFSDGYIDQFGGPKGRKFLKTNFKEMVIKINQKTMDEQLTILENNFINWKGNLKQTDDILVMGFLI
jgi:serine phosphatase RsbU (regulator of sigma subunit)